MDAGEALIGRLKQALSVPAEDADDIAWLAGVLESLIADNPKRLELLKTGIASCAIALKLAELGPVGGVPGGGRFELTGE